MAISTPVNLTTVEDNTNSLIYIVASQTYTSGRLYLLGILGSRTGATPDEPTLTGTGTWTNVASVAWGNTTTKRLTLYRYLAASTLTGTVTITFANILNGACWSLTEVASGFNTGGTNGSGAIAQAVTNTAGSSSTSLTVALAAFATGGYGFGVFAVDTNVDIVPANSYTELAQAAGTAPAMTIESQYKATDADPGATFTASYAGGIGVELKQGAAATKAFPMMARPTRMWDRRRSF